MKYPAVASAVNNFRPQTFGKRRLRQNPGLQASGIGEPSQLCDNHTRQSEHRLPTEHVSLQGLQMTKIATALLIASLLAGCAGNQPAPKERVVRAVPPRNHESAITNYFDATAKSIDPNRELVIGTPQRGACPMGGNTGGYVGWVVPVEYKTRTKDSSTVTVTSYFFWFSDEVIRGVTRRMEVCP